MLVGNKKREEGEAVNFGVQDDTQGNGLHNFSAINKKELPS
jgi:hypothetical protein